MTVIVAVLAFMAGAAFALRAVGYGVRQGVAQMIRLRRYRAGRCQCGLCK
jgi:hypothetical protein